MYLCMYEFMHLCVYVCMYVCMYLCMYVYSLKQPTQRSLCDDYATGRTNRGPCRSKNFYILKNLQTVL